MTQTNFTFTYQVSIAIIHKKGKQRTIFIRTIFKMFTMTSLPLPSPPPKKKKNSNVWHPGYDLYPERLVPGPPGRYRNRRRSWTKHVQRKRFGWMPWSPFWRRRPGVECWFWVWRGGKVIIEIFSKKKKKTRDEIVEDAKVVKRKRYWCVCLMYIFDCEGLFVRILQNDEDEAISNGKTNAFWRHPSPNR